MAFGLNDTILNVGNAAMQAVMTHAQLYTAEGNAAGTTNATSAARQAITWVTAANGDMEVTADASFTGGAASGACTVIGLWSAATNGTFYGYFQIPANGIDGPNDLTFNAAGQYTLGRLLITSTSS